MRIKFLSYMMKLFLFNNPAKSVILLMCNGGGRGGPAGAMAPSNVT